MQKKKEISKNVDLDQSVRGGRYLQNQFDMIPSTFNLVLNAFDTILSMYTAVFDFRI